MEPVLSPPEPGSELRPGLPLSSQPRRRSEPSAFCKVRDWPLLWAQEGTRAEHKEDRAAALWLVPSSVRQATAGAQGSGLTCCTSWGSTCTAWRWGSRGRQGSRWRSAGAPAWAPSEWASNRNTGPAHPPCRWSTRLCWHIYPVTEQRRGGGEGVAMLQDPAGQFARVDLRKVWRAHYLYGPFTPKSHSCNFYACLIRKHNSTLPHPGLTEARAPLPHSNECSLPLQTYSLPPWHTAAGQWYPCIPAPHLQGGWVMAPGAWLRFYRMLSGPFPSLHWEKVSFTVTTSPKLAARRGVKFSWFTSESPGPPIQRYSYGWV